MAVPYSAKVDVSNIVPISKTGRKLRRPSHTFQLRYRPWQIQPFLVAPVWPGETMTNLLLQARCVTDPIKNPLIGWWNEYYFFYVKLRDLNIRDDLTDMIVTNADVSALNEAASAAYYHQGGINYAKHCLERIVETVFRDEDEAWDAFVIDNIPVAKVSSQSWLDSAIVDSAVADGDEEFPGGHPDGVIAPGLNPQFADHYAHWEAMRSMSLTTVDFEDWLKTFGVSVPREDAEPHEPELVRYVRHWQYPSNTVNPTDGSVASAVSWAVAERADKDRFFKEPGFIFGVTVTRPKIYLGKQKGQLASYLNDAFSWLPAVLQDEPYTSLKKFLATDGPLAGNVGTNDYWVDIRDLAMYGDQFVNFNLASTDAGLVALPTSALQKKYPVAADADSMFTTPATLNKVRVDGRVDLNIKSRLEDTSG